MTIYLIRHIATKFNQSGVFMGRKIDLPILSDKIPQFTELLKGLKAKNPFPEKALLFSSPLKRCSQTAQIVQTSLNLKGSIRTIEEFGETDYGDFTGRTSQEIKELYPGLFRTWLKNPSQITFPQGESYQAVQKRAFQRLTELSEAHPTNIIFIVTHVDVIKMIISQVLSIPIDKKPFFRIDNGSISCIETFREQQYKVKFSNLT